MANGPFENKPTTPEAPSAAPPTGDAPRASLRVGRNRFFELRRPLGLIPAMILGVLCIALVFGIWWFVTRGADGSSRIVSPVALPSPSETLSTFPSLWGERKLLANILVTLRRLALGFGLAAIVGIPLGVLAGCFPPVQAFFTPLVLFGRNIPIAALIPLMFIFFGIAETQKIMFIFLACVAFIISDAAANVVAVSQDYVDTAYTLGAKRRHVITKVLVPLAAPSIFQSLRLLFGLAFGYIMLAETVKFAGEEGGLGNLILMSQRRNIPAHIYLIILIVPIIALVIDRFLFFVQRQLFPHRFGGAGYLKQLVKLLVDRWQDFKGLMVPSDSTVQQIVREQLEAIAVLGPNARPYERLHLTEADRRSWRP